MISESLGRLHAVVEREVEIVRQFDRLIARDERGDRDDATVARAKARAASRDRRARRPSHIFRGRARRRECLRLWAWLSLLRWLSVDRWPCRRRSDNESTVAASSLIAAVLRWSPGMLMSHDATSAAQSTVMALTRNTTFSRPASRPTQAPGLRAPEPGRGRRCRLPSQGRGSVPAPDGPLRRRSRDRPAKIRIR